tara:strand:+ start:326 stop:541 length:216 start_codon:yes stop_codon:yes gene_type:complete
MIDKQWLSALKPLASSATQWTAFTEMLDSHIAMQVKKLEQVSDPIEMYRAQGSIHSLRKLKQLKDEIDATR